MPTTFSITFLRVGGLWKNLQHSPVKLLKIWQDRRRLGDFQNSHEISRLCFTNPYFAKSTLLWDHIPLFYIIADGGGECPLKPFRHKSAFCNNSICDQVMPDVDGQSIWRGTKVGSGESYQIDPSWSDDMAAADQALLSLNKQQHHLPLLLLSIHLVCLLNLKYGQL